MTYLKSWKGVLSGDRYSVILLLDDQASLR